ncbi:Fe(3+)-hydroxamate ABC transporter permease FhuB [Aureimonas sp. ME7]|uniref:Fe(3+)-hydroxamate ABC transporter permease FhuB n=1 Tax=Aureimonas sp. ME7 TaxID=2744252 RepID=UPI0015F6B362|nr:Fe(3+)-hydroxamate ABC transporter permease FhuB [Aureimonas sp. ME7]
MTAPRLFPRAVPALGLAALAAFLLLAVQVVLAWPEAGDALGRIVLVDSVLPRGAVALLAGASLGLSGALLQRVLRNPIADPSTLGIASGAQLAMTLATAYAPAWMETAREPLAFAGGMGALGLILAVSWRRGFDPVTVVLCGMLISLVAASLSAAVILANGEYMMSLFIWGGGSLEQTGWGVSATLLVRLGVVAGATVLLLRPLVLLGFDDSNARALGLGVSGMRLLVLGLAVALATGVIAFVGVIGFVGLAAPNLARLAGFRTLRAVLLASPVLGAILLAITDGLVQAASLGDSEILPTGAATALLGGPLLIWLLPRLRSAIRLADTAAAPIARLARPGAILLVIALLATLVGALALLWGPGPDGWNWAWGPTLEAVAPWRWPRIAVAGAAGAMLAAAGFTLQRVTGNPMASPEALGVSSGSGLGLAAVLLLAPQAGPGWEFAGAVLGSGAALLVVLGLGARGGFGPERLLLGGIAVGSLAGALVTAGIARGGPEGNRLLNWLSGSTALASPMEAGATALLALALLAPMPFLARWFQILPLGPGVGRAIGLSPRRAGGWLVFLAAVLSAAATLSVGPLSFVGLMAPHMARLAGFARPPLQFAASVAIGTLLMVFADWMARSLAFPYQLPVGLLASLVGAPYLVWLLNRGLR